MIADRQPALSPVVKRIIVRCSAEEAFQYFTRDFHKWWPAHTHSVTAMSSEGARRPRSCTMDPRPEGRIIEHGPEHEEYVWGTVLTWGPPRRVAFTWHPGQDERAAQIVEVTFSDVAGGTEVVLTHSGFDRLAEEQAALVREGYNNGWESVFTSAFREHVEQHA